MSSLCIASPLGIGNWIARLGRLLIVSTCAGVEMQGSFHIGGSAIVTSAACLPPRPPGATVAQRIASSCAADGTAMMTATQARLSQPLRSARKRVSCAAACSFRCRHDRHEHSLPQQRRLTTDPARRCVAAGSLLVSNAAWVRPTGWSINMPTGFISRTISPAFPHSLFTATLDNVQL